MFLNCTPVVKMKDDGNITSGFMLYVYFDEVKKGYCSHVRKAYDFLRPILCLDLRGFMSLECGFEEYEDGLKEMLDNMYFVNGVGDDCARQTFCSRHTRLVFVCWECGSVGFSKFRSQKNPEKPEEYYMYNGLFPPIAKLSKKVLSIDDIISFKIWTIENFGKDWKGTYVTGWITKVATDRVVCMKKSVL